MARREAKGQGAALSGAPAEVATLPASVPQRIAKLPELMENARLGGVQVRSARATRRVQTEAVQGTRATYERLRKELSADDTTPELFLYAALNEYQLYEDMVPVVGEVRRKQADSEDVKSLEGWLRSRLGR